jgi:mono/diheme cytochrome c family protein
MIAAERLTPPAAVLLAAAWLSMLGPPASDAADVAPAGVSAPASADAPLGVDNAQRAWQHWTLNCQGCHRPDGSGSAGTAPSLAGTVARFLSVPGGREYLGRVPGVATSPLSNADLSEVMNWMLWRFDKEHLPANFQPYTAAEIGQLRAAPLRLEASQMRAQLLSRAEQSGAP